MSERVRHPWTDEQIAGICRLANEELTDREIGERFGKPYWAVRDARHAVGLSKQGPRPVRIVGSDALIPLGRGRFATVDESDADKVAAFRWTVLHLPPNPNCYVVRNRLKGRTGPLSLHRFLLNPPAGLQVDHRDGDVFNNRRSNLRVCTSQQNAQNRRPHNGRKFKGVHQRSSGRFSAVICFGGKNRYLGVFDTAETASAAYAAAAKELFGEFARLP
jgi:hypothetical protein